MAPRLFAISPCQIDEKRTCNFDACPEGTNFLINNAEFHIIWKGCCIGLFREQNGDRCGPIDSSSNAFIQIISSLFNARDSKLNSKNSTDFEISNSKVPDQYTN